MRTIGITGGVGCGKSIILKYISEHYNCKIVLADDVGNKVKEPGESCYQPMIDLLGEEIIDKNDPKHGFDKAKIAEKIFGNQELLNKVNELIHPAVTEYILKQRDIEKEKGEIDFFFIEAALLIECGYRQYVDEMWYIYADSDIRRDRLRTNRGYSDLKIDGIMAKQLNDEQFRANSDFVIDNSHSLEETYKQIKEKMIEYAD